MGWETPTKINLIAIVGATQKKYVCIILCFLHVNLSHFSTFLAESVCNRRTVLLIIPSIFVTASILAVVGFIVFAYNTVNGCDPLANHEIATGNEVRTLYFRL